MILFAAQSRIISKSVATIQNPDVRRALADRIRYYNELGIYDFYRREGAPAQAIAAEQAAEVAAPDLHSQDEMPRKKSAIPQPAENILPVLTANFEQSVTDPIAGLKLIREDIGDCTRCKLHAQGRKQIVFGVGNPRADLMFVGEGPGADEDAQGEPFVGRAGQLLNNMIKAMGIRREDVYIANVVKCRPPGNRTPERDECDTCGPFLMRRNICSRSTPPCPSFADAFTTSCRPAPAPAIPIGKAPNSPSRTTRLSCSATRARRAKPGKTCKWS